MKIYILFITLCFIHVNARRHNEDTNEKSRVNKDYLEDIDENERETSKVSHEKKYSSRKKPTDDIDESEKSSRRIHSSKSTNSSKYSKGNLPETTTAESYIEEASLCVNEFDVKSEQLVKVKELKNGASMIRFIRIEEPNVAHGLDIRDICMLNCCVEKNCDLAMLSEQRTTDGYKCYLFSCNGSCTYAPHQDYTSMILKKDLSIDDDSLISTKQSAKNNEKSSDASSSVLSTTCRSSEFSCRDGTCIPYYDVCNSYEDCPSGIDEAMCSPEFMLHQRTQQENRKKPSGDTDTDTNTDIDEILDENEDEETTTIKSKTKTTSPKSSLSKNKSKNNKQNTSFLYNIDLETQERVSKLQKLKEHLEDTKGPEAWYHLFQTLVQHQQQDHSDVEPEQTGSSSSSNDDDNFKDHLLALEQQWIADRQKTTTTTTVSTTIRSRGNIRKSSTTTTTTKRTKIINNDETRFRRPPPSQAAISSLVDDELTDEEDEDGTASDDNERYYYQPAYDDRQRNRYGYHQKIKTTTRTSKLRYQQKENTASTLLRATQLQSDSYSHAGLLLRESTVILLFLLGLVFTIVLLVLVGFYCRDSWKRGRLIKNRSTDADYLINGLYL